MTTSTTKGLGPEGKSEATIEPPIASKNQPAQSSSEPDLESRIKQRRAELIGKLGEIKTDTRIEATETRDRLKAKLAELAHILKWGIVDGWASAGDSVNHKLEEWLADAARQLAAKYDRT